MLLCSKQTYLFDFFLYNIVYDNRGHCHEILRFQDMRTCVNEYQNDQQHNKVQLLIEIYENHNNTFYYKHIFVNYIQNFDFTQHYLSLAFYKPSILNNPHKIEQ